MTRPIRRLLIANRGAIARRIMRSSRALGIQTIAVCAPEERQARFALEADEVAELHGATPRAGYLDMAQLVDIAQQRGADAIHPGYGFLSENPEFAEGCARAGLTFVGPSAASMRQMGSKIAARELAEREGVPVVPALTADLLSAADLPQRIDAMGYPVLIKAAAGGGGKGMCRVDRADELPAALDRARREAQAAFGSDHLFIEKYLERPRHIEFQILGDTQGHLIHCLERDCSAQRRHQKVIEEAPSPALTISLRTAMADAALRLARAAQYYNAGTIEFLLDAQGHWYFLEMNTRLQVEHAVTEMLCGIDLVAWQLRIAQGEPLAIAQEDIVARGHAIECRVYAEDAAQDFVPATGRIQSLQEPHGPHIRVESGLQVGEEISMHYDPMLAKVIAWGEDRPTALQRMAFALEAFHLHGLITNLPFLRHVLRSPAMIAGTMDTETLVPLAAQWQPGIENRQDPFSPWGTPAGTDTVSTARPAGPRRTRQRHRGHEDLSSPMPGRIVKVPVQIGDPVTTGATLIVLEAMKMEYTIQAPHAGTITKLHVREGDLVERGKILAELAP